MVPIELCSSLLLSRFIFDMIRFWNNLSSDVERAKSAKDFQHLLQEGAKEAVRKACSTKDLCNLRWIYVPYGDQRLSMNK